MYLALQVAVGVVIGLTIFACFAAAIFIWWVGEADLVDQRRAGSPFPENLLSGFAWLLLAWQRRGVRGDHRDRRIRPLMWIAARLLPQKEALALAQLKRNGFKTFLPRIRERRIVRRRVIETARPLFPSYAFISIVSQWHAARWSPGWRLSWTARGPRGSADGVIAELRGREIGGLIELPPGLKVGDRVRGAALEGLHGLYAGQAPAERC